MSADAQVLVSGDVSQLLPQGKVDNVESGPVRMGKYDEQYVIPAFVDMTASVLEGNYFAVNNAQTGLATAAAPTTFSQTNPFLIIFNTANPANPIGVSLILDYLTLLATVIGTGGANVQAAVTMDQGNRYTSGGTEITSQIVNPNGYASASKSAAKIYAGNLVAAAASGAARMVVGNRYLKGAIPVVGDQYTLKFGGVDAPNFISISGILYSLNNVPKIVIPPGWCALVHLWLGSQSAASNYLPEMGWQER